MDVILRYPIWLVSAFVIGACIGSFLNVVIYRVPLGLSVNEPKRSFCPICRKDIPWFRNIPIVTWILQRGKCAECGAPIAFRYVFVEILTACFFGAAWYVFVTAHAPVAPLAALLAWVLGYLLISISFIDAEHMIIPVFFCYVGMAIGVMGSALDPTLITLVGPFGDLAWWRGGVESLLGIAMGWGLLALVVILGKKFLGERRLEFDQSAEWCLREPENDEEELSFVIGDEAMGWSEIFYRKTDRIEISGHGILLDGKRTKATRAVIYRESVKLDGNDHSIEKMVSLSGKADRVVIPREAMGAGDPPLLGLIGAFIGWKGVLFSLFASCIFAILAAAVARVGFGRHLPFGPYLALGAVTWIFGGWLLWEWYFESIVGMQSTPAAVP